MTEPINTLHIECLQHYAARALKILGTATACIPLAEGSDSLILVGLPEQIAKLLPAAANNAAEEGELQTPRAIMDVVDEFGSGTTCYIAEDLRAAIASAITADRASRQVANKAEVEIPEIKRYGIDSKGLPFEDADGVWVSYDDAKELVNAALDCIGKVDGRSTPPATTGASTVLTDERIDVYQKVIDICTDQLNFYAARGRRDLAGVVSALMGRFDYSVKVAAQAGQVEVPEGAAVDGNGTTYHNVAETYYQAGACEALHMWLDDKGAPRVDKDGRVFSPVGRVAGFVQDAERFRWLNHDHDDDGEREKARELAGRMGTSSYFAITRDIDAAMLNAAPSPAKESK